METFVFAKCSYECCHMVEHQKNKSGAFPFTVRYQMGGVIMTILAGIYKSIHKKY